MGPIQAPSAVSGAERAAQVANIVGFLVLPVWEGQGQVTGTPCSGPGMQASCWKTLIFLTSFIPRPFLPLPTTHIFNYKRNVAKLSIVSSSLFVPYVFEHMSFYHSSVYLVYQLCSTCF